MWSVYGDQHKGCYLQFRISLNNQITRHLALRHIKGEAATLGKSTPICDYSNLQLQKVQYSIMRPEVNFFDNAGRMTFGQIHFWSEIADGSCDRKTAALFQWDEQRRANYWQTFDKVLTSKLPDWNHEAEYRLTLHSMIHDTSKSAMRKLKYKFEDLSGIIFGISTPLQNKIAVMSVIEEKCRKAGRMKFNFCQAYYSTRKQQIALNSLDLVKFRL